MKTTIIICIITVIFLIFYSSSLLLIQELLISCTEKNLYSTAFTFASICTQLGNAGTIPMIYGTINGKYKNKYPWLAMVSVLSLNLVAVPLLILLAILRNIKFDEEEKRKEQSEELNDI